MERISEKNAGIVAGMAICLVLAVVVALMLAVLEGLKSPDVQPVLISVPTGWEKKMTEPREYVDLQRFRDLALEKKQAYATTVAIDRKQGVVDGVPLVGYWLPKEKGGWYYAEKYVETGIWSVSWTVTDKGLIPTRPTLDPALKALLMVLVVVLVILAFFVPTIERGLSKYSL